MPAFSSKARRIGIRALRSRGPVTGVKGTAALQLGIIIAARPLQRIGPGMIEDIFALAVAFQIERQQGGDRAAFSSTRWQGCQPVRARGRAGLLPAPQKIHSG